MQENIQAFNEFNSFGDDVDVPNDIESSTTHVHLGSHQKLFRDERFVVDTIDTDMFLCLLPFI